MTEDTPDSARGPVGYERSNAPGRPPVLLGCLALVATLILLVGGAACAIVFLESGADSGTFQLDPAEAYAPGSVEFVGERNLFVVRTPDGEYFALLDLDAANRANQGTRCRVQLVPRSDPELVAIQSRHQSQFSSQAAGLAIVFREDCNGALYDATGVRLDNEDARNLDRYRVDVAANGRLEVRAARRCTRRSGTDLFLDVRCD